MYIYIYIYAERDTYLILVMYIYIYMYIFICWPRGWPLGWISNALRGLGVQHNDPLYDTGFRVGIFHGASQFFVRRPFRQYFVEFLFRRFVFVFFVRPGIVCLFIYIYICIYIYIYMYIHRKKSEFIHICGYLISSPRFRGGGIVANILPRGGGGGEF